MPIINTEDIRGYQVNEEIVCIECAKVHENAVCDVVDDIITHDEIERDDERSYFCDRCGELL